MVSWNVHLFSIVTALMVHDPLGEGELCGKDMNCTWMSTDYRDEQEDHNAPLGIKWGCSSTEAPR